MSPSQFRIAFIIARCVAAGFAFYATAKHPHSFYTITRWVVFITCCFGLWLSRARLWPSFAPAYGFVAIIFNPLLPFHFARPTWHNLDIGAGVILLASLPFHRPSNDSSYNDASQQVETLKE